MRQALGPGALGRPKGIGWRGRWEGGSGWGTHVNPWLIHFNVWQNPLQYCKVISLQLKKKKQKKLVIQKQKRLTSILALQCTRATTRKSILHVAYMFDLSTPLHDAVCPAWNASADYYYTHMWNSAMQPDTIFYVLLLIHIPSLFNSSPYIFSSCDPNVLFFTDTP